MSASMGHSTSEKGPEGSSTSSSPNAGAIIVCGWSRFQFRLGLLALDPTMESVTRPDWHGDAYAMTVANTTSARGKKVAWMRNRCYVTGVVHE